MADSIDTQITEETVENFVVKEIGGYLDDFIISSLVNLIKTKLPNVFSKLGPVAITAGIVLKLSKLIIDYENAWIEEINKLFEANDIILYGDSIYDLTQKIDDFCGAQMIASSERLKHVESLGEEIPLLQTLADKYFELGEKAHLTKEEYAELRLASENLVKSFPELEQYYDKATGKINLERDAVNKLIELKKQESDLNVVSEKWGEAIKDQIVQQEVLDVTTQNLAKAEQHLREEKEKMAKYIEENGADANLAPLQEGYTDAALEVEKLTTALKTVKEAMAEIDEEVLYYETIYDENYDLLQENQKKYADEFVGAFNESIVGNIDTTKEAVGKWIDSSNAVLKDSKEENNPVNVAGVVGDETILAYNTSLENGMDDTMKTLTKLKGIAEKTIMPLGEMFFKIGQLSMDGLTNGLASREEALYNKAIEITARLKRTIELGLEIHSPSKVMYRLGVFTIEGFKNGMESMFDSTCKSIEGFNYNILSLDNLKSDYSAGYNRLEFRSYHDNNISENVSANTLIPYLVQIAQNTKESATRNLSVNIGDREIAKANHRGKKALGRQIVSGI